MLTICASHVTPGHLPMRKESVCLHKLLYANVLATLFIEAQTVNNPNVYQQRNESIGHDRSI